MTRTMADLIQEWEAAGGVFGRGTDPVWHAVNKILTDTLEGTGPVQVGPVVYLAIWDDWNFVVTKFCAGTIRPAAKVPVPDPS